MQVRVRVGLGDQLHVRCPELCYLWQLASGSSPVFDGGNALRKRMRNDPDNEPVSALRLGSAQEPRPTHRPGCA